MKNGFTLAVAFLIFASLAGCKTGSSSAAITDSSQLEYEVVGMLTLDVGNGVKSQATIEHLKDSISAIPVQKPRSRLIIKNLSTGKIIYQEECGDSTLSYPGFDIGGGAGLVMITKGGSGDGI